MRSRLLASTFVLTILVLTHPALVWGTDSFAIEANPTSVTVPQGGSAAYTITLSSFGEFNLPVTLGVTGLPAGTTYSFSPPAPQPSAGRTAQSILSVAVGRSTPAGSYPLNVTGIDTSSPPIQRQVIVTLDVIMDNGDFSVCVSPNSLTFNVTESKTAIVTVTSIGPFNQNVTLSVTGLPAQITATFDPPAPRPLAGSTASSIMRINVGAINGTFHLIIIGSNGTCGPACTRDTTMPPCSLQFFTLIIPHYEVMPPPSTVPFIGVPEILLAVLLGLFVVARTRRRKVRFGNRMLA